MFSKHRLLAVISALLLAGAAVFGWAALGGSLGLTGDDGAVTPSGNWSLEDAQAFEGFTLFWAGEEYAGLPLTAIIRADYVSSERPEIQVREDSVTFLYGSCVITGGEGGCAAPFQITIRPFCQSPPGLVVSSAKRGEPFQLRGVLAQGYTEGAIELWTRDISITLFADGDRGSTLALAQALRSLNSLVLVGPGSTFEPPQTTEAIDCPQGSPSGAVDSSDGTP